ncbi:ESPR-type extended signal peptide-containing protein, partial [Serratia fonticola]
MNTIYRLVWNATLQTWVVASEFASAKGKGKNGTTRRAMIRAGTMASAFAATLLTAGPAQAWVVNPTSVQNGGTSASDGGVSTNTAIGTASVASGAGNAIAIGAATAAGQNDIAIGNGATTFGGQANVVVGMNAKSTNATDSVALGNSSYVQGKGAVAAGLSSYAVGDYSQAIGASARSTASYSSALGFDAQATASGGMALGYSSRVTATAANGIAIGKNASVSGTNSVALGAGAVSDNSTITSPAYNPTSTFTLSGTVPVGEVSLGTANNERRITNVGAGAKATDAVNVSQLQSAAASLTSTVAAAKTHYVSINDNGTVGANYNNDGAGGSGSMAIGVGAVTSGTESLAMGLNASAKGSSDLVLGRSASSAYSSQGSVVLGNQAKAGMATGGIAVGALSFVQGMNGVAMGSSSYGGGNYSLALGASAQTNADYSNAIGYDAQAAAQGGLALGQSTRITSTGANGTAIGRNASVSGGNSVALGAGSVSDNSTMASAAYNPYTSFTLAGATPVGEVSIGTAGNERRITNVAAGSQNTDAVNVSQLKSTTGQIDINTANIATNKTNIATNTTNIATNTSNIATNTTNIANNTTAINSLQDDALQWDATLNAFSANHLGAGPATITNVAPGQLSATSTDAVNGSQLNDTNNLVSTNTTDIATNTANIATNTTNIANNTVKIDGLKDDALQWDATLGAFSANHMSNGSSKITNVAAGDVSATSSDAVNGSQLFQIAGDTSNTYITSNGTGVKYVRTNSSGLAESDAYAHGEGSTAIGYMASTDINAISALAMGNGATASVKDGVALGSGSVATTAAGIAGYMPTGASAAQIAAIAATTSTLGGVSVGDADNGQFRQINGVAAGTAASDAVNVAQLQASIGDSTADTVLYDSSAHNQVTLGGVASTTPVSLTNVAAGNLSATSTDAVNGSQLNATNDQVATNTTNIATNTANIAGNTTDIANNTVKIDGLQEDALQWDATANGGNGAYSANHLGAGPNKLTNVAAGELSATSTDAVNGSQLNATNDQVATNTTDIANNATNITHLGDEISNVYDTGTKYFHANSTGTDSVASGVDAVAIGMGAIASADNSVALGAGSLADGSTLAHQAYLVGGTATGEVNVGDRRITGLSAGADNTDAVNVAQLQAVTASSVADAVMYDGSSHNRITLGGNSYNSSTHTGGATITNVADGVAPSDAVNFSQLTDTNNQVATNTTNIANNTANIAGNTTDIANNTVKIDGLQEDALQWDATANGGNGAYSANHLGAGPNKLT